MRVTSCDHNIGLTVCAGSDRLILHLHRCGWCAESISNSVEMEEVGMWNLPKAIDKSSMMTLVTMCLMDAICQTPKSKIENEVKNSMAI